MSKTSLEDLKRLLLILQTISDEADHVIGTEATDKRLVAVVNCQKIKKLCRSGINVIQHQESEEQ